MIQLPKARIVRDWKIWIFRLIPVAAALLAGWFIYDEIFRKGPEIHIIFDSAAGLEPDQSQVKYRGVRIGKVTSVQLTEDRKHADVTVSLEKSAEKVAREKSRFWIVKPRVGLEGVKGLKTIVSGMYITVLPGEGKQRTIFRGLPNPPKPEKGLKVVLLAERLGSFKEHSPLFYRGVQVGEVEDYDFDPLSQTVVVTAEVKERYALVRMGSKFWNAGGIDVNIGLSGIQISANSAETLLTGGVAFATPDSYGARAPSGTAFRIYDKPQNNWLKWSPRIRLAGHRKSDDTGDTEDDNNGVLP